MRVAVIGCGIFGALVALRLADAGHDVTVLERREAPLLGATANSQNRLHLGFHYPRDWETARQCVRGFRKFVREFPSCVVAGDWDNAYFVASEGSRTSLEEYLRFIERLLDEDVEDSLFGVGYAVLYATLFRPEVRGVAGLGVVTTEVVYDASELRAEVLCRLEKARVVLRFDREISHIERYAGGFLVDGSTGYFDAVVNCTYADVQRLGAQLGHAQVKRQYEYTVIPIVEWDQSRVGITIMDGPFASILPYGRMPGRFLVYHVDYSVVSRECRVDLPAHWRDAGASEEPPRYQRIVREAAAFVPSLASAKLVGCLSGPRVVLAGVDATDARPSIVDEPESRYLTVLSGKVDHCVDVAEDVVARLGRYA